MLRASRAWCVAVTVLGMLACGCAELASHPAPSSAQAKGWADSGARPDLGLVQPDGRISTSCISRTTSCPQVLVDRIEHRVGGSVFVGEHAPVAMPDIVVVHGDEGELPGYESSFLMREIAPVYVVSQPIPRVSSITMPQLRGVLSGSISDWQQLGGLPGPIHVYRHGGAVQRAKLDRLLDQTFGTNPLIGSSANVTVVGEAMTDMRGVYAELEERAASDSNSITIGIKGLRPRGLVPLRVDGYSLEDDKEYPLSMRIYVHWLATDESSALLREYLSQVRQSMDEQ